MKKNEVDFININSNNGGGKFKYNKTKRYKVYKKNIYIIFTSLF